MLKEDRGVADSKCRVQVHNSGEFHILCRMSVPRTGRCGALINKLDEGKEA